MGGLLRDGRLANGFAGTGAAMRPPFSFGARAEDEMSGRAESKSDCRDNSMSIRG